jgi:formylglycine-generating enzyme required for sulfatase activity
VRKPVGSFPPNKLGLHDMSRKLWEWVSDIHAPRCSKRHMHCRPTARFDFVGFRLVLEAE